MEIFVEDGDCPKSRFLQLEFGYLQIIERNLGKIDSVYEVRRKK